MIVLGLLLWLELVDWVRRRRCTRIETRSIRRRVQLRDVAAQRAGGFDGGLLGAGVGGVGVGGGGGGGGLLQRSFVVKTPRSIVVA